MNNNYDLRLWGKRDPFCSLSRHMIAVGACASVYLRSPGNEGIQQMLARWMRIPEEDAVNTFCYICALHDIGKAHPSFQNRHEQMQIGFCNPDFRHEQYGAFWLQKYFKENLGWDRRTADFYAAVVAMHHQGKGQHDFAKSVPEDYKLIQEDLEKRMRALFNPVSEVPRIENADALGVLLSGILILCDWVASNNEFGAEELPDADDHTMLVKLMDRSFRMLNRFGLISDAPESYPRLDTFSDMWTSIPNSSLRPLQKTCEQIGAVKSRLTIIEAPMGEGKTEAALYLAGLQCRFFNKRGIYMALPTAATSNQMVMRVREMLASHNAGNARLLHAMAWLVDEKTVRSSASGAEDSDTLSEWLRPLRRGLLSENAVGTVDQAMNAALKVKYGVLRLAGLAGKVLIIDEIHAYDIFMSTIIARLLEWCRALEIPVILLSATMQNRQKQRYLKCFGIDGAALDQSYPLITQVTYENKLVQTGVCGTHMHYDMVFRPVPIGGDPVATANLALQRAANGGCICVMLNTVRQAQLVYRELKSCGAEHILLFHARFTAKRRADIEKICMDLFGKNGNRPERMILVCTQVVEQSLDVDFDAMITQLAPMDLLLQRAGRVHRHSGRVRPVGLQTPTIDVLIPEEGASENPEKRYVRLGGIYPDTVMYNTEEMLKCDKTVSIPKDVRECVEQAYKDISGDSARIKLDIENQLRVIYAEHELLSPPKADKFYGQNTASNQLVYMDESDDNTIVPGARTRDGNPTQQFVFLQKGFPKDDGSYAWRIQSMDYLCSIALTKQFRADILNFRENSNNNCEKTSPIIIRESEDGLYHLMGHAFSVSDEYGIEEVSN